MYPYYKYTINCSFQPFSFPPQQQPYQPGLEYLMYPRTIAEK